MLAFPCSEYFNFIEELCKEKPRVRVWIIDGSKSRELILDYQRVS